MSRLRSPSPPPPVLERGLIVLRALLRKCDRVVLSSWVGGFAVKRSLRLGRRSTDGEIALDIAELNDSAGSTVDDIHHAVVVRCGMHLRLRPH